MIVVLMLTPNPKSPIPNPKCQAACRPDVRRHSCGLTASILKQRLRRIFLVRGAASYLVQDANGMASHYAHPGGKPLSRADNADRVFGDEPAEVRSHQRAR